MRYNSFRTDITDQETNMSDSTFDPKAIFETYRNAFAPALKAQQEGITAIDRVGRYQYAVAGDYLEWSLAQAKAALGAQSPAEFVSKQVELTTALSEKLRARAQEFVTLATETQNSFTNAVNEASAKVAEVSKKKAG
jgi:phasin family protein